MASENNEALEVCGAADDGGLAPSNEMEEEEGTEMTTLTKDNNTPQSEGVASQGDNVGVASDHQVEVHTASLQEPSVFFVVKDITDTDWSKSRYNCTLPHSTAVTDLYSAVAKESGYDTDSFLLAWGEKEVGDPATATPLSPNSTQTLYELDMPSEPQRCYLILQDGPDSPPTKAGTKKDVGGDSDSVGVVNSVSTVTSSHTLNNNPNTWNSGHYMNKSDTGFVGLVNQAMTCYLNSLLQTLYMTPEFRKALYSWNFSGDIGEGIKSISYQLQRLFIHLQTSSKRAVETTDVTKSFGWDSSEAWQQHDVQELCRVMFDALEKRFRKDAHEHHELINELYQGDMKDYVKCLECNNESAREDHFLDIPLVIKPFGVTKAYGSVDEALDGFVDPETLSGDNQYFCAKCKKKCDAHKGLKFTRFPYLLTLQLKRFDFDYSTMHRIKLNDRMTFPNVLNLNKFVDSSDRPDQDLDQLDVLYKDFKIEKFEKHSTHIMQNETTPEVEETTKVAQMLREGPYVYELFSIMIHSGSAIGGHYYAYIKSLSDKLWYSFNDQSVTRISRDDIEQTFGGTDRSRGYYSSIYASSANAYMLMYRRIDVKENAIFPTIEELPPHIIQQIEEEHQQEIKEKERQEWEKNLCKFRVFMRHPSTHDLVERKIEVHKDKTLRDATLEAFKVLGLSRLVPIERCRLVRYDEYTETLDQSFDHTQQDMSFGSHVGGARSYYSFELFMEIRAEDTEFKVYNKGGLNLKVLVIDLPEETVREPVQLRAEQGWTIEYLKQEIANHFGLDSEVMLLALETYHNEGKSLQNANLTLKNEGFYRKHTVFACCDSDDYNRDYHSSIMNQVIDKHANTTKLFITIPPPPPPPPPQSSTLNDRNSSKEEFEDNFVNNRSIVGGADEKEGVVSDGGVATNVGDDEGVVIEGGGDESVATEGGGDEGVATEGGGDEGMATEGGDGGVATGNGSVAIEGGDMDDVDRPLQRTITLEIDRRKTLGDLKEQLKELVMVPATEFKIYRVYSNNQEYEIFRLQDSLQSVPNETKMIVRLGRALLPGEFHIKLSLLRINEVEFFKSVMDSIVSKSMTVRDLKERLVKEAYVQGIETPLKVDRIRLRKKTWRSPGTIYLDHQVFEKDIHVFANYEMFIEPLENEDPMKHPTQMQVYIRHWRPSSYTVDKTAEIILNENTPQHLKLKLSEFSDIPAERIQFAKAFGSFPCEMCILDIESDLDWNPVVSTINSSPLAIYDDGAILYFKDTNEVIEELTSDRRSEIQKKENARLSKFNISTYSHGTTRYTHRQEKALKIWTDDDDVITNSPQTASES